METSFLLVFRKGPYGVIYTTRFDADVAQLAEQLICNQQVAGSSPIVGSGLKDKRQEAQDFLIVTRQTRRIANERTRMYVIERVDEVVAVTIEARKAPGGAGYFGFDKLNEETGEGVYLNT